MQSESDFQRSLIVERVQSIREAYSAGLEAGRFAGDRVRLALFEYISLLDGSVPDEVSFQLDEGMFGGSDLIFNTKRAQVYMVAPWQSHNFRLGMDSSDWLNAFPKIINGIHRVRVKE